VLPAQFLAQLVSRRTAADARSYHDDVSHAREANIVSTERESQTIRYSLPEGIATQIINLLHREFCER
jgi:hypothetical protein